MSEEYSYGSGYAEQIRKHEGLPSINSLMASEGGRWEVREGRTPNHRVVSFIPPSDGRGDLPTVDDFLAYCTMNAALGFGA